MLPHEQFCEEFIALREWRRAVGQLRQFPVESIRGGFVRIEEAVKTWDDYFKLRQIEFSNDTEKRLFTQNFTCIMTIFNGLQSLFNLVELQQKESLVLDFLGAEDFETDSLPAFEELFHLLPNLNSLIVRFIGPSVTLEPNAESVMQIPVCEECTIQSKSLHLHLINGCYHDIYDCSFQTDLLIANNAGLHSRDIIESWRPTLKLIIDIKLPCIFTCMNEYESREDYQVLVSEGANFLIPYRRNPFASLLPFPEPFGNDLFYHNQHFA